MKSSIAITLIVCGTILIAVPYIHQTIVMQQVTSTMVALERTVNLTADLPKHASTMIMIGGFLMIISGGILGTRLAKSE